MKVDEERFYDVIHRTLQSVKLLEDVQKDIELNCIVVFKKIRMLRTNIVMYRQELLDTINQKEGKNNG